MSNHEMEMSHLDSLISTHWLRIVQKKVSFSKESRKVSCLEEIVIWGKIRHLFKVFVAYCETYSKHIQNARPPEKSSPTEILIAYRHVPSSKP